MFSFLIFDVFDHHSTWALELHWSYILYHQWFFLLSSLIHGVQKETVVIDIDDGDDAAGDQLPTENKECASESKRKKVYQSASGTATTEVVSSTRGSLVQATISTLFKKVEEKVSF